MEHSQAPSSSTSFFCATLSKFWPTFASTGISVLSLVTNEKWTLRNTKRLGCWTSTIYFSFEYLHRSILGYIIVTVKPNLLIVNVLIKCSRNTSSQGCVFQETFLSKCKTMVRPCVKEISSLKWISRNCEPSCQYWNTPPPTGAHKRRSWQTHGFVVIMNYFQHKLEKQTKERELCSECVVVYLKLSLYTLATY